MIIFLRKRKCILSCFVCILALIITINSGYIVKASTESNLNLIGVQDADGANRFKFVDKIIGDSLHIDHYLSYYYSGCNANSLLYQLRNDSIIIHTHGDKTKVKCTDANNNVSYLTTDSISDYQYFFYNKFVVYGTCSAGEGGSDADNIVNATANNGTKIVIGFEDTTYVSQTNQYLYDFYKSLGKGNTFSQAMADGLYWAKFWNLGDAGGLDKPYTRGCLDYTATSLALYK